MFTYAVGVIVARSMCKRDMARILLHRLRVVVIEMETVLNRERGRVIL